jgi:hypothetical protein
MSDCLKHNIVIEHLFQRKQFLSSKTVIDYFCHGVASNFISLCHTDDFGMDVEWHFFATSCGNKNLARKACLQNSYEERITRHHNNFIKWLLSRFCQSSLSVTLPSTTNK